MAKVIYGVALNGTSQVVEHKVLLETPKTYTIDRPIGSIVRKCVMADRWTHFYEDRHEAEAFLHQLLEKQEARLRKPDMGYIHSTLLSLKRSPGVGANLCLTDLISYVESFLDN